MPWIDTKATHRLGLTIAAGANDRFDLPVELELVPPPDLVGKPARAFVLEKGQEPREVLVQLDALRDGSKARLVLVLPGPLAKDAQMAVHVYLGLPQAPTSLPGAVRTRPDTAGRHWIENDQVRALLGPEGAHVYRWEVLSAAGRDLTMPGESGWAGFSDIGTYRGSPYRLDCTARGPAMVEFECHDGSGHGKAIRFYGHARWMEVFLDEPTPVYWDFDDPKNFAADGPTPGTWLFSNGESGAVGREADGVPAQVRAGNTHWGIKFNADQLALGLITPGSAALHLSAPGSGAGGVGIEGSPPAQHFVTFAGKLEAPAAETMNRLQATLEVKRPVSVQLHALQTR
jgi:hypothetical protein